MAADRDARGDEWDLPSRVRWLERISEERDKQIHDLKAEIARLKGILVGLLISTTTAAIVAALVRSAAG